MEQPNEVASLMSNRACRAVFQWAFGASASLLLLSSCEEQTVDHSSARHRVEEATMQISAMLNIAGQDDDLLLEKELLQLQLLGATLKPLVDTPAVTDSQQQAVLDTLADRFSKLVAAARGGQIPLSEFGSLETATALKSIPLRKGDLLVSGIEPFGVKYDGSGDYTFYVHGATFKPGREVTVMVDNEVVASTKDKPGSEKIHLLSGTCRFSLPAEKLDPMFHEAAPARARITIVCSPFPAAGSPTSALESGLVNALAALPEQELQISWSALLLPKHPIAYSIQEKYLVSVPSDKVGTTTSTITLDPVEEGETGYGTIRLNIPAGTEQDGNPRFEIIPDSGHCVEIQPKTGNLSSLWRAFSTTDTTTAHEVIATVNWRKTVDEIRSKPIKFSTAPETQHGALLSSGTHFADLDSRHSMFDATFTYFNGQQVVLHSDETSADGISIKVSESEDGLVKRLVATIEDPYGAAE